MKTFDQLTPDQQVRAIESQMSAQLTSICEGFVPHEGMRERIMQAAESAERMETPWFMFEYVMDTCAAEIRALAVLDCEVAIFREPHEFVLDEPNT